MEIIEKNDYDYIISLEDNIRVDWILDVEVFSFNSTVEKKEYSFYASTLSTYDSLTKILKVRLVPNRFYALYLYASKTNERDCFYLKYFTVLENGEIDENEAEINLFSIKNFKDNPLEKGCE